MKWMQLRIVFFVRAFSSRKEWSFWWPVTFLSRRLAACLFFCRSRIAATLSGFSSLHLLLFSLFFFLLLASCLSHLVETMANFCSGCWGLSRRVVVLFSRCDDGFRKGDRLGCKTSLLGPSGTKNSLRNQNWCLHTKKAMMALQKGPAKCRCIK